MRLRFTKAYIARYAKLSAEIRTRADRQLARLLENPQHPSLRLHKMQGHANMWEISITMNYRIMFRIEGDEYVLESIGTHDILR